MTPSLSVIIPTYNRAEFVRTCLASLRDSGVSDLEVIVVDDGSTDNTREVVAEQWPGAIYSWGPNTGNPSAPRNRGFAISTGRYVCFLDCDDRWLPGMPAQAVAILDHHPQLDVLFADAKFGNEQDGFTSWIELAGQRVFRELPKIEREPHVFEMERGPLFHRLVERNVVYGGACLLRRNVFAAYGGFDTSYWGGEDWELWMRMAAERTFGFWDASLAVYTRHPGNVTNDAERMTGGFAQALRNVLKRAPNLLPSDRRWVRRKLGSVLFAYAYHAYDRGDLATARVRFAEAIRAGNRQPLTLALWAVSQLPPPLFRHLRRTVQTMRGTG